MTWFVYKRHGEHDFLIRHDLGEHWAEIMRWHLGQKKGNGE